MSSPAVSSQLSDIEYDDRTCNDERLGNLYPVDSSKDIDGIRAKDSKHSHVHIVENTCEIVTE